MSAKEGVRTAMTWLHSWAGLVFGTLLFAIWWMGTLSVFDKEIDRWMQPETRIAQLDVTLDVDRAIAQLAAEHPDDQITSLLVYLPSERVPYADISGRFAESGRMGGRFDPDSLDRIPSPVSSAGSGFIYPMHYRLHMGNLGYWIVALATICMMMLLVTGVVIHRKIFVDFFTFRAAKKLRRASLDLHNISGVLFLPFHFVICISGLAIFAGFYASYAMTLVDDFAPENRAVELFYAADDYAYYLRDAADQPAEMLPINPMIERAEAIWTERYGQPAQADRIDAIHYGDAGAYVEVRRHFPSNRTEAHRDSISFDGATGEILSDFQAPPVRQVRTWLEGFHQIRFDHWPLRWLYFAAGVSGCVLIGSGFIFWTASRRKKAGERQPLKIRFIDAISVGSVTGIILATGIYLVANRVLPPIEEVFGQDRADLEIRLFFWAWTLTFAHAAWRQERAWIDQSWVIAGLCVLAPSLNWFTTGATPLSLIEQGGWQVLGMDLVLLASALVAASAAVRVGKHHRAIISSLATQELAERASGQAG